MGVCYCSYEKECDIKLYYGDIIDLLCPGCDKNLKTKSICSICGAPVINLRLVTGGILRICSRIDCKKRNVIFEDIYGNLTKYFIEHDYKSR